MDDLTFSVEPGQVVGFLGPNGAGKTTAMRSIFGIVQPDSGELLWEGHHITHNDRLRFGYMPEERGLYGAMFILEQLIYLGRLHGMTKSNAQSAAEQWLQRVGLIDRSKDRLDALSMGNQQRVQMAAALVHNPSLLVLDEPFSGLDPTGIEALGDVLKEQAHQGCAVVFSSHQLDLVESLCDHVVIINKGHTVITGPTEELTISDKTMLVKVDGDPEGNWANEMLQGKDSQVQIESVKEGMVRLSLNDVSQSDYVLATAQHHGSIKHFSFEKKRLSEVFREAVQ